MSSTPPDPPSTPAALSSPAAPAPAPPAGQAPAADPAPGPPQALTPPPDAPSTPAPPATSGPTAPGRGARLRGTARARAAKLSTKQWGAGATGLALVASAAFGGLDEAAPELVPAVPGEPVAVAPFDLTVTRAVHATSLTEALPDSSYGRYLLVFAELGNTSEDPVDRSAIAETVRLVDVEGLVGYFDGAPIEDSATAAPQLLHALDSTTLGLIGPGMSYSVAFLWEQTGEVAVPAELDVELRSHERRRSTLDRSWMWADPAVVTTVTVPVDAWAPPQAGDGGEE